VIYFTADLHFHHKNILTYCNRPFKNAEEMDETLITNWNSRIKAEDLVYFLGDVGFGDISNILRRLNGHIVLISGSHDKSAWQCKDRFDKILPILEIKIENQPIVLCHYSMRSWSKSFHGSWHLFGHSHGRLEPYGKSFDVGVDGHSFFPWSWEEVKKKMSTLENNKD
jgi:calcineurin-like phosphoesterase family protein